MFVLLGYLHFLKSTVEAGGLARPWGSRDVEAARVTLQNFLLQKRSDGFPFSLSGQEPLWDGSVERLLHILKL